MGISWAFLNNPVVKWVGIVLGVLLGLKFYGEKREADGRREERSKSEKRTRIVVDTIERNSDEFVETYRDAAADSPHFPTADSVPGDIGRVIFKRNPGERADLDGGGVPRAETPDSDVRRISRHDRRGPRGSY